MINEFIPSVELHEVRYFHRYLLEAGYIFEGHTHSDKYELNVFFSGGQELTCGKSVFNVQAGEAVLVKTGVFHASRIQNDKPCDMLVLQFVADGLNLEEDFYQFHMNDECVALVNMLLDEAEQHCEMNAWGTMGRMTDVSKKLIEILMVKLLRCENNLVYLSDKDSLIYHRAVKFMEQSLDKNPTVEEVARAAGVCVTLIKRAFNKYAGKGVNSFFIDMKIKAAQELLQKGESCYSVSEKLGFSSQAYFSRCFKKVCGVLPSKYTGKECS